MCDLPEDDVHVQATSAAMGNVVISHVLCVIFSGTDRRVAQIFPSGYEPVRVNELGPDLNGINCTI